MPKLFSIEVDMALFNVILLGITFMILFSAELAAINMQKTIISSIHDENANFEVDGYFLHGVSYSTFAISLWLAPSVVCFTGARLGMFLSGIGYIYYLLAFTIEEEWAVYSSAVVVGLSSAVLWTAQSKYLLSNSTPETRSRNISIFWFLYSSSEFYGNLYLYFHLEGKKFIDAPTRCSLMYVLSSLSGVAILMMLVLRPGTKSPEEYSAKRLSNSIKALKSTWSIFMTKEVKILYVTFFYVGLQQAFAGGVYSSSVGFTLRFGKNTKQLVALSGTFIGAGEMICGVLQVMLSKCISQWNHSRFGIVLCGFSLHLIAFVCIYLNLPDQAVFGNTYDSSYIENSVSLVILSSLMLGLADCCLNTQVYSLLAVMHPENGAQTCALYKFSKAVVKAFSFYCSNHFGLHTHLLILTPSSILGVLAYYIVDLTTFTPKATNTELLELNQ